MTGILGLAIIPVVLGIIGLSRINRTGQQGKGMAIAGIVLGAIGIIVWIVVIVLGVAVIGEMDRRGVFEEMTPGMYGLAAMG